ncbi:LysR family transcriptional regulator [Pseudarthrobacter sp. NPDC092419]|uniref:LysR family transcriptional regulator n=1 Tax=Pseudarthrobacter sp. NPDC092419 TaxID=3364414 RepID=UPI00381F29BF
MASMETRRLEVLVALARHGSMRNVADALGTTTSTVSQQLSALAREAGTPLLEPLGRGVRLTPAGRRLAERAVDILASVEAATAELDPRAEPAGTVRVAGFATAVRKVLMPIVGDLARIHPEVRIDVREHEPAEALALLSSDAVDLALTYDYNLAPDASAAGFESTPLWSTPWSLGVPADVAAAIGPARRSNPGEWPLPAPDLFHRLRDADWIGNSRNSADEEVLRLVSSMAGFEIRVRHQADSLELVEDLIIAGMGVGLLPADRTPRPGVALLPLANPDLRMRAYARTRRGGGAWPAAAAVLELVRERARNAAGDADQEAQPPKGAPASSAF